jgi:hypothetical protein
MIGMRIICFWCLEFHFLGRFRFSGVVRILSVILLFEFFLLAFRKCIVAIIAAETGCFWKFFLGEDQVVFRKFDLSLCTDYTRVLLAIAPAFAKFTRNTI